MSCPKHKELMQLNAKRSGDRHLPCLINSIWNITLLRTYIIPSNLLFLFIQHLFIALYTTKYALMRYLLNMQY